jgi:hypothetical protein
MSDLRELLDDLIASAAMDAEESREDYSPATNSIRNTIIERYSRGADAPSVARAFHETYERLAPEHGYRTREASAVGWDAVPTANRALMIATVQHLIDAGVIKS